MVFSLCVVKYRNLHKGDSNISQPSDDRGWYRTSRFRNGGVCLAMKNKLPSSAFTAITDIY
jgi:hypothetical protein